MNLARASDYIFGRTEGFRNYSTNKINCQMNIVYSQFVPSLKLGGNIPTMCCGGGGFPFPCHLFAGLCQTLPVCQSVSTRGE